MIQGSLVALVTPMHPDGSVDKEAFRRLVDWHVEQGTDVFHVLLVHRENGLPIPDELKQGSGRRKVLVVDDEPNVRDYLAQILRDAGFNVVTASDGDEALEIIHQQRPDFISLDLVMPKKSGHKLLYELRKDRQLSRIPFVVVTA